MLQQASQTHPQRSPSKVKRRPRKGARLKLRMVLVIFIKTKYNRLDGQVGKPEAAVAKTFAMEGSTFSS